MALKKTYKQFLTEQKDLSIDPEMFPRRDDDTSIEVMATIIGTPKTEIPAALIEYIKNKDPKRTFFEGGVPEGYNDVIQTRNAVLGKLNELNADKAKKSSEAFKALKAEKQKLARKMKREMAKLEKIEAKAYEGHEDVSVDYYKTLLSVYDFFDDPHSGSGTLKYNDRTPLSHKSKNDLAEFKELSVRKKVAKTKWLEAKLLHIYSQGEVQVGEILNGKDNGTHIESLFSKIELLYVLYKTPDRSPINLTFVPTFSTLIQSLGGAPVDSAFNYQFRASDMKPDQLKTLIKNVNTTFVNKKLPQAAKIWFDRYNLDSQPDLQSQEEKDIEARAAQTNKTDEVNAEHYKQLQKYRETLPPKDQEAFDTYAKIAEDKLRNKKDFGNPHRSDYEFKISLNSFSMAKRKLEEKKLKNQQQASEDKKNRVLRVAQQEVGDARDATSSMKRLSKQAQQEHREEKARQERIHEERTIYDDPLAGDTPGEKPEFYSLVMTAINADNIPQKYAKERKTPSFYPVNTEATNNVRLELAEKFANPKVSNKTTTPLRQRRRDALVQKWNNVSDHILERANEGGDLSEFNVSNVETRIYNALRKSIKNTIQHYLEVYDTSPDVSPQNEPISPPKGESSEDTDPSEIEPFNTKKVREPNYGVIQIEMTEIPSSEEGFNKSEPRTVKQYYTVAPELHSAIDKFRTQMGDDFYKIFYVDDAFNLRKSWLQKITQKTDRSFLNRYYHCADFYNALVEYENTLDAEVADAYTPREYKSGETPPQIGILVHIDTTQGPDPKITPAGERETLMTGLPEDIVDSAPKTRAEIYNWKRVKKESTTLSFDDIIQETLSTTVDPETLEQNTFFEALNTLTGKRVLKDDWLLDDETLLEIAKSNVSMEYREKNPDSTKRKPRPWDIEPKEDSPELN